MENETANTPATEEKQSKGIDVTASDGNQNLDSSKLEDISTGTLKLSEQPPIDFTGKSIPSTSFKVEDEVWFMCNDSPSRGKIKGISSFIGVYGDVRLNSVRTPIEGILFYYVQIGDNLNLIATKYAFATKQELQDLIFPSKPPVAA